MKRILVVSTDPSSARGGIATAAAMFSKGLQHRGFYVTNIVSHSPAKGKLTNTLVFSLAIIRLVIERLKEGLQKERPGLVYLHVGPKGSMVRKVIFAAISKTLGYKIYTHFHSATFENYLREGGIWNNLTKTICNLSDKNIVLSSWWLDLFKEHNIKNLAIIPNLIEEKQFTGTKTTEIKKVLAVSRLVKEKNIQLVIKAISYLPPEYELIIGGDGPYRRALEELTKELNISNRVIFSGWLTPRERDKLYLESSVLAVPSEHDSFGLIFIEALSLGCPVVVGPNPAILSALTGLAGVFNTKSYSSQEIADAILTATTTDLNKESISHSCHDKYGMESVSDRLSQLFNT